MRNGVWRQAWPGQYIVLEAETQSFALRQPATSGNVNGESDYYPFGGERVISSTVTDSFRFAGMKWDSETGLSHTLYRKFTPAQGRAETPDPARGCVNYPQGHNRYGYVAGNPTNFTDPSGDIIMMPLCDPFDASKECACDPFTDPYCPGGRGPLPPPAGGGRGTCHGTVSNFAITGTFDRCKDYGMYLMQQWSCDEGGDKVCCGIKQGAFERCCSGYGWTPISLYNGRTFYTDCCSKTKRQAPLPGVKAQYCPGG